MSKGPGKTQRLILETLERYGSFYLSGLSGGDMARYKSLHRAASRLWHQDQIEIFRSYTIPSVILSPAGTELGPTCGDAAREWRKVTYENTIRVMHALGFDLRQFRRRNWAGEGWISEKELEQILQAPPNASQSCRKPIVHQGQ